MDLLDILKLGSYHTRMCFCQHTGVKLGVKSQLKFNGNICTYQSPTHTLACSKLFFITAPEKHFDVVMSLNMHGMNVKVTESSWVE